MFLEAMVEGLIKGIARFVGEILIELVIKGPGYYMVKWFSGKEPDTESISILLAGLLFWILVAICAYSISGYMAPAQAN